MPESFREINLIPNRQVAVVDKRFGLALVQSKKQLIVALDEGIQIQFGDKAIRRDVMHPDRPLTGRITTPLVPFREDHPLIRIGQTLPQYVVSFVSRDSSGVVRAEVMLIADSYKPIDVEFVENIEEAKKRLRR